MITKERSVKIVKLLSILIGLFGVFIGIYGIYFFFVLVNSSKEVSLLALIPLSLIPLILSIIFLSVAHHSYIKSTPESIRNIFLIFCFILLVLLSRFSDYFISFINLSDQEENIRMVIKSSPLLISYLFYKLVTWWLTKPIISESEKNMGN